MKMWVAFYFPDTVNLVMIFVQAVIHVLGFAYVDRSKFLIRLLASEHIDRLNVLQVVE